MGKSKKSKQNTVAAAAKCSCDHPYQCSCGNRPPRPSKGHKWDPEAQEWGGKGHKQKGASGQTASLGQAAKTTSVGGTQIAQWQRLPSTLLSEHLKKMKRPPPKYKNIGKKNNEHLFRLILPDPKRDSDKDMFFVPSHHVGNEEQAKEEAAMLALLELTPTIPHERKLPEPYKTTWVHAVNNKKSSSKSKADPPGGSDVSAFKKQSTSENSSGAKASTTLTMANSFTSKSAKRKQQEEKKREKNARIRRHEAIRMANQNHPVFLSAQIRQQIQALLRGDFDATLLDNDADDIEFDNSAEELEEVQLYVESRLHNEGFTWRQARTAFQQTKTPGDIHEDKWESVYEECLQWLCIHLDESDLPEGFDPRGGTLDVVVPKSGAGDAESKTLASAAKVGNDSEPDENVLAFSSKYGISTTEGHLILKKAEAENTIPENIFWNVLQKIANVNFDQHNGEVDKDDNLELAGGEVEVLNAMFPSEVKVEKSDDLSTITIMLTKCESELQIVVKEGDYPQRWPTRILVSGKACANLLGGAIHLEIIKFMGTLSLGEPMAYEIYGFVQDLLSSSTVRKLKKASLLPALEGRVAAKKTSGKTETQSNMNAIGKRSRFIPRNKFRPRERSAFWSMSPKKTPSATAFPKISKAMDTARKSLPAYKARSDFLDVLKESEKNGRVSLVTGDTGCGKTTQIPQFILEEQPDRAKIVVAQPRRLAATGVAGRVANERGEDKPGAESVGYVVRGDSLICNKTRLLFCTTGVLLRQLQNQGALENVTHIIVDEVHERHLDTDILLGILKRNLKDFPQLQVILMSATLDADRFAAYWGKNTPRMHIPGRTFPVADFMLEDVLSLTGYIPPKKKKKNNRNFNKKSYRNSTPFADSEKSDEDEVEEDNTNRPDNSRNKMNNAPPIEELVARVDEANLDYDLLARLVKHLVFEKKSGDDGSILVFLSGAPEINNAMETIKRHMKGGPVLLLPLHGGLQSKEQHKVFDKARLGITKVILSTNVAETSITIPDCTIVIDSCREKESSYDPANRMPLLVEHFASKASLKQRRGRAGRVRKGVCYKLVSKATYEKLKEHGDPEIRRCALDQTLLSLLYLGVEQGSGKFLGQLLDPPSQESIDAAIFSLTKLGAVEATEIQGEISLTPLGMHLAGIPAPPSVGKLLVMGSILGCRSAALAMAAGMSLGRSPFLRINTFKNRNVNNPEAEIEDMKNEKIVKERSVLFEIVGNSDHALLAAIFSKWEDTSTGGGGRKRFCESLGLSFVGMKDMAQLVRQYDSSLRNAGYSSSQDSDRNMNSWRIIRTCVVAALAPSQLVRVHRPSTKYVETIEGATEKDAEARELKFFIRPDQQLNENGDVVEKRPNGKPLDERVFIHPSSGNFKVGNFSCPWLVYHSLVRTTKPFLRDASECSAYALLLFAGKLEVQAEKGVVCVDNWVYLSAKARIGSLIGGLRQKIDELLAKKIESPTFDLASTQEMKLIVKLLVTDGLGN